MRPPSSWHRVALAAVLSAFGFAATLPAAQQPASCEAGEDRWALDFLLGEWRLVSNGDSDVDGSGGEVVGRSRVEKLEGGCLIAETWAFEDGRTGRTYSSFDAAAGVWRRFSVSNRGVVVRASGVVEDGVLVLRGERVSADGAKSDWGERLTPAAGGRISRVAVHSRTGRRRGQSADAAFEGYYDPVGQPAWRAVEPPPPAAPEPPPAAPEPAAAEVAPTAALEPEVPSAPVAAPAAGEVTPDSARATDAAAIERIAMATPMVLRLALGAVERLPEGYAWITRDTAPYLCEGVTIERLHVERRQRRDRVELEVELGVHGIPGSRRVEVEIELRRAGAGGSSPVLAAGTASGRVGRNIPEQIEHGSVALQVPLEMTAEAFNSAVADPERPEVVITLAVGK